MFVCSIYAPNAKDLDMLGYVQYKSFAYWEAKLYEKMAKNDPKAEKLVSGLSTLHTRHRRENGSKFSVYHTLLLFQ